MIYEQRYRTGGLWNFLPCDSETSKDLSIPQVSPHAGHDKPIWGDDNVAKVVGEESVEKARFLTPVYERLETNIPRGLMGFSDLEWPRDCQLFPRHEDVLEYIERYAEDVQHLIQFQTQILDVRLTGHGKWIVKTRAIEHDGQSIRKEEIFDAVIVASGHFNVPYIPQVDGIEAWRKAYPGAISHSKFYRKPEPYTGKKVVVVGNSASGIDISAQIETVCRLPLVMSQKSESYLNVGGGTPSKLEKPPIAEFIVKNRSVRFEDGTVEMDIDTVLYCTGYLYSYPFLDSLEPAVITTGERVEKTYQHIFYQPHSTLSFVGLNQRVIPFPVSEVQSAVIARVLSGRLPLPTEEEMRQWEEEVEAEMGTGGSFHVLKFPKDANHINMLHDWATSVDSAGSGVGKTPPKWGEKEYWTRERFPNIKKAFHDLGEARHQATRLEDVGYDFDKWKQEKEKGEHVL